MAEIRVEPKRRSLAWLWVLLLLIVAAAVAWYFMYYNNSGTTAPRTGQRETPALVGATRVASAATSRAMSDTTRRTAAAAVRIN